GAGQMPIDNVVEDDEILTSWGNDVADTVNAIETLQGTHTTQIAANGSAITALQTAPPNHASRHLAAGADPLAIPAPTVNVYAANATWTKPAGARWVRVRAVG